MASEKAILNDTLVDLSSIPLTMVWRNNTGSAWQGKQIKVPIGAMVKIQPGMIVLAEARPITFGLKGSGDIMGVSDGRAISIEIKTTSGRQSDSQVAFGRAWEKAGGVYILARSADEARYRLALG